MLFMLYAQSEESLRLKRKNCIECNTTDLEEGWIFMH